MNRFVFLIKVTKLFEDLIDFRDEVYVEGIIHGIVKVVLMAFWSF